MSLVVQNALSNHNQVMGKSCVAFVGQSKYVRVSSVVVRRSAAPWGIRMSRKEQLFVGGKAHDNGICEMNS